MLLTWTALPGPPQLPRSLVPQQPTSAVRAFIHQLADALNQGSQAKFSGPGHTSPTDTVRGRCYHCYATTSAGISHTFTKAGRFGIRLLLVNVKLRLPSNP